MQFSESESSLSQICRAVEARVRHVPELTTLVLPVVLLPNFDSFPEAKKISTFRRTPAAYQREKRRIVINAETFFTLSPLIAEAVLAHEIAHALCDRDSLMKSYESLHEDILADLLVCRWGFLRELREERLNSYGPEYCEILDLWRNEEEYVRRMAAWHTQWVLDGLVGKRRSVV